RGDHEAGMREVGDLLLHRLPDLGIAVAHGGHRDARAEVDELVAVDIDEDAALASRDVGRQTRADPGGDGGVLAGGELGRLGSGDGGGEDALLLDHALIIEVRDGPRNAERGRRIRTSLGAGVDRSIVSVGGLRTVHRASGRSSRGPLGLRRCIQNAASPRSPVWPCCRKSHPSGIPTPGQAWHRVLPHLFHRRPTVHSSITCPTPRRRPALARTIVATLITTAGLVAAPVVSTGSPNTPVRPAVTERAVSASGPTVEGEFDLAAVVLPDGTEVSEVEVR